MSARPNNAPAIPVGSVPVPSDAQSVLLFGGSFDPPHVGHFRLPALARDAINVRWLVYVPAARSPFKSDGPVANGDDRVAMLSAGLAELGAKDVGIATLELERAARSTEPSYTIDTLREIRERVDERTELRLLIGADQAREFHRWREAQAIIDTAEPVVMLRAGDGAAQRDLLETMRPNWSADEMTRWEARIVPLPLVDASSTEIRRIIRTEGATSPRLAGLLPKSVLHLFRRQGLYSA